VLEENTAKKEISQAKLVVGRSPDGVGRIGRQIVSATTLSPITSQAAISPAEREELVQAWQAYSSGAAAASFRNFVERAARPS
jgi:hypothetical protein